MMRCIINPCQASFWHSWLPCANPAQLVMLSHLLPGSMLSTSERKAWYNICDWAGVFSPLILPLSDQERQQQIVSSLRRLFLVLWGVLRVNVPQYSGLKQVGTNDLWLIMFNIHDQKCSWLWGKLTSNGGLAHGDAGSPNAMHSMIKTFESQNFFLCGGL